MSWKFVWLNYIYIVDCGWILAKIYDQRTQSFYCTQGNKKEVIGSLFDPCVNANGCIDADRHMGQYVVPPDLTWSFGAIFTQYHCCVLYQQKFWQEDIFTWLRQTFCEF